MPRPFAPVLLLAALAACSDINYQAPVAWQGSLLPRTDAEVTGSVAAVSQGRRQTQAGIEVNGPLNTTLGWQINLGTCDAPGAILGGRGAYADFTTNETGVGRISNTFISALMPPDGQFHAVVVDPDNRSVIVACGNLERASF
jgi:hypothetical protein